MTPQRTSREQTRRVGPLAATGKYAAALDIDALLDDPATEIIVCCGSGGVGKTTTSAALALRAAERGRKVVVLTIDPARRLAQSMGIEALDNTPRPVPGVGSPPVEEVGQRPLVPEEVAQRPSRRARNQGSLDAMMLDMKSTFDEVVEGQASPEKAKAILENPFYVALSTSFAGTQEYMAMEKLGQLHRDGLKKNAKAGKWDLIVVDTPPSRSALDFLDAPERLSSFLDGRFIRLLLAPARGPAKLMSAGFSLVTNALTRILGAQVLRDLQTFVAAFDTLFGGFRQRAQKTFELLQADGTAFLVVAAPEPDAMREAAYFVERLSEDQMPLAGLVVNRASTTPESTLSADGAMAAAERLRANNGESLTAGLLRLHADRSRIETREALLRERFAAAHPDVPTAVVPALATDIHDLDGLRQIGELLAG
jgi:anion-transporting  ArsA/GET3 family ATPase